MTSFFRERRRQRGGSLTGLKGGGITGPKVMSFKALAGAVLPGAVLVCSLLGCSGSLLPARDDSSVTIDELKRRVLDLQRQATINEVEIARLRQRVAEVEARPQAHVRSSGEQPLETLVSETGPIEPYRPPEIEEVDLDPVRYAEPVLSGEQPGANPGAAEGEEVSALVAVTEQGQQLYDRGYSLYHQGRFVDAEAELRSFLASYADTDLADNAQYWIGESRYARKDFPGALAAFRETVERFPGGNKVPDALVKAGQCFEAQGDLDSALETYREVVQRYPQSAAAARAAERARALR
ncbi:MAG: tol-pal system protein YbgF [Deltaproteobacteria bacterium]|nr:tol-pal system protein YbgF [Deltaproteobacteria bacterium]